LIRYIQFAAVSLADCIAATAGRTTGQPLATADPALATLIRAEGGHIHPLPGSNGQRP
jgi:hypothetical protein